MAAHPSFAQVLAQSPASRAKPADPPGADGLGPRDVYIEADSLIDNRDTKVLTAQGHVEARYQGRTLRANTLVYDSVTGVARALGDVSIRNADGSVEYGQDFTLDDSFRSGVAMGFAARLQDNVTIAAGAAIRRTETVSEMRNAIYTPCSLCKDDKVTRKTPTWSVQASRIIQDKEHQVIYYQNAVIRVLGVPVFYAPVFWHPDPTASRRSGLLTPKIQYSKRRGFSYQQPYLFTLSPSQDLIIAPQVNTRVNPFIGAEYTQRFYSGELDIRGGYTHERIFNSNMFYGADTDRSFILAHGRFNFDKSWDWGFGAERATDPTLFRRYGVQQVFTNRGQFPTDTDRLISQIFSTRTDSQSYLSISAVSFQSVRVYGQDATTKLPIYESNKAFPAVAPLIEARWDPSWSPFGGRLRARGSAVVLSRNNTVFNLVDPLGVQALGPIRSDSVLANPAAIPGLSYTDSRRASGEVEWRRDLTFMGGLRLTPFVQARGDVFSTADAKLVTVQNGATATGGYGAVVTSSSPADSNVTRGLFTAGFTASYPLIRQTDNYTAILEPVGQLLVSPRLKRNLAIPNEDSVSFEYDESTLFSTNRLPGMDLAESGARLNVGGRASVFWGKSGNASVLVGRTFRDAPDPAFQPQSGVEGTSSDWVTYVRVQPNSTLTFYNRARLDSDTLKVHREEAGVNIAFIPKAVLTAQYNYNENGLVIGPTGAVSSGKTQDFDLSAVVFPFKHWGASALVTRDFQNKIFPVQQYSLIYRDDCIRLDLVYTHDQILGAAIGQSSSLVLRLTLTTLGDTPVATRRNDSR
jgi:LPS-assembly protein